MEFDTYYLMISKSTGDGTGREMIFKGEGLSQYKVYEEIDSIIHDVSSLTEKKYRKPLAPLMSEAKVQLDLMIENVVDSSKTLQRAVNGFFGKLQSGAIAKCRLVASEDEINDPDLIIVIKNEKHW